MNESRVEKNEKLLRFSWCQKLNCTHGTVLTLFCWEVWGFLTFVNVGTYYYCLVSWLV